MKPAKIVEMATNRNTGQKRGMNLIYIFSDIVASAVEVQY